MTMEILQAKPNNRSWKLEGPAFIAARQHRTLLRALKEDRGSGEEYEDESDPPGFEEHMLLLRREEDEREEYLPPGRPSEAWLTFMGGRVPPEQMQVLDCWPRPGPEADAVRIESDMRRCWGEVDLAVRSQIPTLIEKAYTDSFSFCRELLVWLHCVNYLWFPRDIPGSRWLAERRKMVNMVKSDPVVRDVCRNADRIRKRTPEERESREAREGRGKVLTDSQAEVRARNSLTARKRMQALRERQRDARLAKSLPHAAE